MALPLNLIATIISHVDDQGDLARLCRTCRVLNYMALPELYRHMVLTSYDRIRYRDEQPEGMGSASPFTMGLNAVITRPFATLELEEHARVGRVPDASMLLNIAVRAAVDRMTDLESFSWELSTKMLETVYQGLAQRPRLQSLTLRFPSSRHPRPTIVIPAMPHLRYLKVTDIDPLCYPDDISTLLFHCRKLRELKMHWSPRMRNEQEPSVKLHDYFRKCISARRPLAIKKLGLQNLYALHSEEFNLAFDSSVCEAVTILSNTGSESPYLMNTFVDSTWPTAPPNTRFRIKSVRQDNTSRRHVDFLRSFTGLERLYFVSATGAQDPDHVNNPRRPARLTAEGLAQTDGLLSEALGDPQTFSQLKMIGLGRKGFQLGGYYTIPVSAAVDRPVESQCQSQSQSQSQTPTGTAPPTNSTTPEDGRATTASPDSRGAAPYPGDCKLPIPRPQPPSLLGKRQREDEHAWVGDPATDADSPIACMPPSLPTADGRLWRRQVKRVGWETLRRWEIWGLDTQEL
ncbi:hypothetical protein BDW42DRAFT_187388 [Aspergillus taichungensis]|uniref:Uncharacterized protein n=1 Tax=Aspergillus taichungensis TaxID=482145 RepID=A0A2J5HMK2_9EURO|nr:hypothetical protein BDW42DRAFT_187388 [Aspergillus taichungensis]